MKHIKKAMVCFLAALVFSGCSVSPSAVSSAQVSSEAAISSEIPAVSSKEEPDFRGLLAGKTVADIQGDDAYTFVLTSDGKVCCCGAYQEGLEALTTVSEEQKTGEKQLFELSLPEPVVQIAPYAAVGESGTLYILLYPATAAWQGGDFAAPEPLVTVPMEEKIREITYSFGDFWIVTESGKVFTVGELTLYGYGISAFDPERLLKPVPAVVPEPMIQVAATDYTVFLLGKSGTVYMAFRYFYNGPDGVIPSFISDSFPLSYSGSYFRPVETEAIRQLAVGSSEDAACVYLVAESGAVYTWEADRESWAAYYPGQQTSIAPRYPEISFTLLETEIGPVSACASAAKSEFTCFFTEDRQCYAYSDGTLQKKLEETVTDYCITPGGLLYHDAAGKLLFYGADRQRLLIRNKQSAVQEITWLEFTPIMKEELQ